MGEHQGKVAVITGAGSGLGEATARLFAAEGAQVCVADLDFEAATQTVAAITNQGGEAFPVQVDVSDPEANVAMVEAAMDQYGAVHLGYLNAGVARWNPVVDGDVEVWKRVVDINLSGVYYGLRAIAKPIITSGGGAIVATASIAGWVGNRGMASYFATKHGVMGLVKSAAAELARHNVRVNAVCPGVINTPILGLAHDLGADETMGASHAMGRLGRPEEVAQVVSFLCSDRASFITASPYLVDGGSVMAPGGPGDEASDVGARMLMESFSSNTQAFQ